MPKQIDYTLTEDELKQVQIAMKDKNIQVARRAGIVHSLHLGYKPEEVAQLYQVSRATVHNSFNRFQSEGQDGFKSKPIPGRPCKANPEYIQLLETTLESDPKAYGFAFTIWTQARLRQYLNDQTGISLSRSRFQELMKRLDYVYRRPKYDTSHRQDETLRQQVEEALDELKKEPRLKKSNYSLWTKA